MGGSGELAVAVTVQYSSHREPSAAALAAVKPELIWAASDVTVQYSAG